MTLVVAAAAVLVPTIASAQPNARQIERDLKRQYPDLIEVRIRPDAAGTRQTGPSSWEHQQMVEILRPSTAFDGVPGVRNVRAVIYGGVTYLSSNQRRWTYERFRAGETYYDGVPTPTLEEVHAFLRAHRYEDFFQYEDYIVGMPEFITSEDARGCHWMSTTRLRCRFDMMIDMKRGRSIARMPRRVTINLYRDEEADEFATFKDNYNTSWSDNGSPERIDPSAEELAAMTMLKDILAALPEE